MTDKGSLIEKAHPVLKDMLDRQVKQRVTTDLLEEKSNLSSETFARLVASKSEDTLKYITEVIKSESKEKRSNLDSKTGLKNGRVFWEDLEDEVQRSLGERDGDSRKVLNVVRIDLGMLNAVNAEAGHSGGDEYKRVVAKKLINPLHPKSFDLHDPLLRFIYENFEFFSAYIVGGDEFSLIIRGETQKVREYMGKVMERLSSMRSHELDILPRKFGIDRASLLDWGVAQLDNQMREDFFEINFRRPHSKIRSGDAVRCAKFLNEVADTKADMNKMYKRIHLLRYLYKEQRDVRNVYDFLYQFSAKATWGISENELSAMNKSQAPDEIVRMYVENSFSRRAEDKSEILFDPFLAHMNGYIAKHIAEYMTHI